VFFYQAWRSGQRGRVTRVASGCKSAAAAQQLRHTFQEQVVVAMMNNDSDRFSLHITPDYSTLIDGVKYKFFNKPYGILHWLEEGLQFPMKLPMHDDTIIVIMDPDQFLLRPLRGDYTDDDTMKWHGTSPHLHDGTNHVIRIQKGRPFAQWYAVGVHFVSQVNVNVEAVVQAANYTADRGPSHLHNWTEHQVRQNYAAGPPYLAVASDMYDLVKTWAEMAGPVYQLTTDHLSEMYAYATAAAHLNLPHQLSTSFMVSDPDVGPRLGGGGGGEDWTVIDTASPGHMCELANDDNWTATVPPIVHYCQRYRVGPHAFSKYRLPRRFLSCDRPLLQDPHKALERGGDGNSETIGDLVTRYNETEITVVRPSNVGNRHVFQSLQQRQRHAYMLCQTIRTVNAALTYWKQHHCNGDVPVAKLHKSPV
jgi:peptidyl serine alpha-galactosyltransferase